jgi:PAS domain S-box-containing protein
MFDAISILIVDDHEDVSSVFKRMLSVVDYSNNSLVTTCKSLEGAEAIIAESDIDVVVLDLFLEKSISVNTLKQYMSKFGYIPVVVITGHDVPGLSLECFRLGASDFLTKPLITPTLLFKSCLYAVERERAKQAEVKVSAQIKKQRDLVQKYLDVVSVVMLILDENSCIDGLNKFGCELLGYDIADLKGKNWVDTCIPDEIKNEIREYFIQVSRSTSEQEHKNLVLTKSGSLKTIEWRNAMVEIDGVKRIICSGIDVTLKEVLTKRNNLLIRILKLLNEPYSGYETLRQLLSYIKHHFYVDAVAIRLIEGSDYPYFVSDGFSPEFIAAESYICNKIDGSLDCMCGCVIGNRCRELGFGECFTELGSFWTNSSSALLSQYGDKYSHLFRGKCKQDGYESIAIVPLKTSFGIIGTLQLNSKSKTKFVHDAVLFLEELALSIAVGVQRSWQEDRIKALEIAKTRDLLQSSRLLNSGIAHELRTPMQAMLNCLELIKDEVSIDCRRDLSSGAIELIDNCSFRNELIAMRSGIYEIIDDGIDRAKYCVKVLDSLSEYSKIASDKEVHPIDVLSELKTVIRTLRFTDQFKAIDKQQFRLEQVGAGSGCKVLINRVDFTQLISNLCRNSIEAINNDSPEIIIRVKRDGDHILIKVVDNGRGIDSSLGDKIFEPYFSTKSNPDNYNQGLGLAMVRDIILAYGGSVDYNSVPGKTEFIVKFPCEH